MRILNNFKSSMAGIMLSLSRYPIVIIWLMAVTVMNALQIHEAFDLYSRFLFTGLTGTMFALVGQHSYERFTSKGTNHWLLAISSLILAILYYFTMP
ncbi:hypothetical protein, partial [Jeotgalibaca porci]